MNLTVLASYDTHCISPKLTLYSPGYFRAHIPYNIYKNIYVHDITQTNVMHEYDASYRLYNISTMPDN